MMNVSWALLVAEVLLFLFEVELFTKLRAFLSMWKISAKNEILYSRYVIVKRLLKKSKN